LGGWAQTLGLAQDNGQPLSRDELLKTMAVYDDASGQVLHPVDSGAWSDYPSVAGSVRNIDGRSYAPLENYQQGVSEADQRAGSILTNGPLQLFGALAGGALASGLGFGGAAQSAFPATWEGGSLLGGEAAGAGAGAAGSWGVNPRPEQFTDVWDLMGDPAAYGLGGGEAGGGLSSVLNTPTGGVPGVGDAGAFDQSGSSGTGIPGSGPATSNPAGGLWGTLQGVGSGASGAGSLLSQLFGGSGGSGSGIDWTKLLGGIGSIALGVLGANKQADAYGDIANQYLQMGAPYRDRLNASYAPGFDLRAADPLYAGALSQSADEASRAVSAQRGNPYGNPGAMADIQQGILNRTALPYAQNYRGQLGQFGGLGLNTSSNAALAGASNQGGAYDALGYGLSQLTNPQSSLQDLMKQFGMGGGTNNYGLRY
jgi:hypothetical protein